MAQEHSFSDLTELNYSKERRVKNEQLFFDMNKRIQDTAKELIAQSRTDEEDLTLKFVCECSDASCVQKIELDVATFGAIHNIVDQYVVISGHEQTDIENVIETFPKYSVVSKFYKIED